jgi:hypothetical protein
MMMHGLANFKRVWCLPDGFETSIMGQHRVLSI